MMERIVLIVSRISAGLLLTGLIVLMTACSYGSASVTPASTVSPNIVNETVEPQTAMVKETPTMPAESSEPTDAQADAQFAYRQAEKLARSVNLGNALEAPREGEWGVTLQAEYFRLIHEAGFSAVRIPISWSTHTSQQPPYTIDPDFFSRVDWAVKEALSNDLAVVINIHHFNELISDPEANHDKLLSIWNQVAERYKDQSDDVFFELLNEPNGSMANIYWNKYAAELIALIRKSNPDRTLIVGPGDWNSPRALNGLILPEEDRNIIVTFHFYDPFSFTHQGAEWVDPVPDLGITWEGTENDKLAIHAVFKLADKWAQKHSRPLFLGEFGAYGKADMESRARWTEYVARTSEEYSIGWSYWEFCSGFGLYDPEAKSWNQPLLDALIAEGGS